MIKKGLLILASLVFGVGVLTASAYRSSERVLAQKIGTEGAEGTGEMGAVEKGEEVEVKEEAVEGEVDYVLPYPGILPDNKLYFLKMLRDKIWGLLIFDEAKKIDWLVLMGDKRLAAGKVLIDTGKVNLGVSTILKGEKYMSEAMEKAEIVKEKNVNIYDQLEKLRKALLKHREILGEEIEKIRGEERESLEKLVSPLEENYQKANQLLGREEEQVEEEKVEKGEEDEGLGEFGEE
jgi:hypothetical protein